MEEDAKMNHKMNLEESWEKEAVATVTADNIWFELHYIHLVLSSLSVYIIR